MIVNILHEETKEV